MMIKTIFLFVTVILFASCDSIKVVNDYDKSVDFKKYKTIQFYGWEENSDRILNRFDKERIENAVSLQFRKRGHRIVKGNADLVVSLYVISETRTKETSTTINTYVSVGSYYGYGPGWGWGPSYSTTIVDKQKYQIGTLVISVYDAAQKRLIWEGVGQGSVNDNPGDRETGVNRAIDKIMYHYPVKPLKK